MQDSDSKKGKLITLYGINNIGKSTHAKKLVKRLKDEGHDAIYLKYPVYDLEPTGPFINSVLRGGEQKISEDELQMWFVLNRYQNQKQIESWLEEGKIVIAEDYTGTGIAWGVAKGLSLEWLESLNQHLLKEDIAILFEGVRDVRAKETGHVHEQNDELVEKCRNVHEELAERYGWRIMKVEKEIADTADKLQNMVIDAI